MEYNKAEPEEKKTEYVNAFLITESTKKAMDEIRKFKSRDLQEVYRFSLNALAQRWRDGKRNDEDLY